MSLKDMFQNVVKQTNDYIEKNGIKEKVAQMKDKTMSTLSDVKDKTMDLMVETKDKTMDKMKGVDNPAHYSAPTGFIKFTIPVIESNQSFNETTLSKLEPFALKDVDKVAEAYIRLLSLLLEGEGIIGVITASMKKLYLIVWTSKDRIIIVHKECYKILTREQIHTFKIEGTGMSGMTFSINEYRFIGTEKSKIYYFIRRYCHELTPAYQFTPYLPVFRNLNYYERFKYGRLNKENQAVNENKQLCILFSPFEFPLASAFVTCQNKNYIITLSTDGKLYLINEKEYTILDMKDIMKIGLMNKGVFSSEFYMDNYYFTNCGPENSVLNMIQYITNREIFNEARTNFLNQHQVLMTFPFKNATSYQTPSKEGIIISQKEDCFLICLGVGQMEMHGKDDFDHYEMIIEVGISKGDMWTTDEKSDSYHPRVTKEQAIANFENARIRLFLKNEDKHSLEVPFLLVKKMIYNEIEETSQPSAAVTRQLLDQLDCLHHKGEKK